MLDYAFNDMKMHDYDYRKLMSLILKSLTFALIFGYIKYRNQVKKNN